MSADTNQVEGKCAAEHYAMPTERRLADRANAAATNSEEPQVETSVGCEGETYGPLSGDSGRTAHAGERRAAQKSRIPAEDQLDQIL